MQQKSENNKKQKPMCLRVGAGEMGPKWHSEKKLYSFKLHLFENFKWLIKITFSRCENDMKITWVKICIQWNVQVLTIPLIIPTRIAQLKMTDQTICWWIHAGTRTLLPAGVSANWVVQPPQEKVWYFLQNSAHIYLISQKFYS